ncbi:TetR/AcrR family transcriptional regulator [Pannonibacter tanglangensis]
MTAQDGDRAPGRRGPRNREATRERLIDAAMDVVFQDGARRLSLEAVAERAGVSKGGLLYHFRSKSELLQAMVDRHLVQLTEAIRVAHAELTRDNRPNALVRAYLMAVSDELCMETQSPMGLVAAIAEEPELLEPVRLHNERLLADLRADSETPELAELAFLVVEGAWYLKLFGLNHFTRSQLERRLELLTALLAAPPPCCSPGHADGSRPDGSLPD